MERKRPIIQKYIIENGVNFEKKLYWSYNDEQDEIEEDGRLFTGITYELYPNGNIKEYMFVEKGIIHGKKVIFYPNGKIKKINNLHNGILQGTQKYYDEDQNLKRIEELVSGYLITYTEYDSQGNITAKQEKPDIRSLKNAIKIADEEGKKILKKYIKDNQAI